MVSSSIVEGLFAIHKPTDISSAQVIRDVQKHFNPSALFRPWLEDETARLQDARKHMHKAKFRKGRRPLEVKMGHGGTLDPLATGVLVLGVGSGTKKLGDFIACTKSYDTVLLFGQATDTYDILGKTTAEAPYEHITKEQVEVALDKFRGKIMQRPPIYSALRVQGKKLYEYAREGKEVPVEIKERPVTVEKLELLEWLDGGSHPYHWPQAQASDEEKQITQALLKLDATADKQAKRKRETTDTTEQSAKKVKEDTEVQSSSTVAQNEAEPTDHQTRAETDANLSTINPTDADEQSFKQDEAEDYAQPPTKEVEEGMNSAAADFDTNTQSEEKPSSEAIADDNSEKKPDPCPAPACRLRMTVTSGFYVRSLCHDLGEAVGSLGIMAALVRTRQGQFELGKNVFEYDELEKGEDVWGPQIKKLLEESSVSD